jgi:hypothetical protein
VDDGKLLKKTGLPFHHFCYAIDDCRLDETTDVRSNYGRNAHAILTGSQESPKANGCIYSSERK